jgi:UDP-N-acetylglucosamine:LPS N-acetylglucosamine transferase
MNLARVLEESKISGESLVEEIKYMLDNMETYKNAGKEAKNKISFTATEKIVNEILKYEV